MTTPVVSIRLPVAAALVGLFVLFAPPVPGVSMFGVVVDGRFVVVNVALFALALLDYVLAPAPDSVEVRRVHPSAVTLGSQAILAWEFTRRHAGRPARVSVADDLAPSLGLPDRRFSVTVPADGSVTVTQPFVPARRGLFEPSRLVLRTHGPLGLLLKQRRFDVPTALRVLPPFRSAEEAELSLKRARLLEVGIRSARARGSGTDFDSLREMGPDDESRRIDWAATARTGKPIVRVFRTERNQTVNVLLDSGRIMAGRIADVPRIEHAIDGAMMLAEITTALGDKMGLIAFDDEIREAIPPSNRRRQRSVIADRLFDLHPSLVTSNFRTAISYVLASQRRRSLLILMTDLEEQAVREYLLPTLPMLVRTHVVVVASVADPDIDHWSRREIVDEDDMFLRAAAIEEIERRRRVSADLSALGARVIDEPPERFSRTLGDLYLDIKSTAKL